MQLGAALVGLAWSPSRGLQTPQVVGLACLQQTTSYSPGNKLCAHIHRPYLCHVTDYFSACSTEHSTQILVTNL